jgi:hypothetical protein
LAMGLGFTENSEAPQRVAELGQGCKIGRLQFAGFDITSPDG